MAWVDVEDGVIAINHGQARQDVGNAIDNTVDTVTAPVRAVEGAIDNVNTKIDEFNTVGQQQGYGEAVWQDIVQPIGEVPGTTKGAIIGAGGALVKDILDPTPGINPTNIAVGGIGGALVGAATPYAYDAVQALSNPNSILRGETWSKAGEGLGIASGVTGPIDQNIQNTELPLVPESLEPGVRRVANVASNVGEGLENMYQGGLAGTNQLGADVAGFFGFDDVAEMYQVLADNRRDAMNNPNSAVGAVAQETTYDAGMGGVLGKTYDATKAIGLGAKNWQKGNIVRRGGEYVSDRVNKYLGGRNPNSVSKDVKDTVVAKVKKDVQESAFPLIQSASDLLGTFSPKSRQTINNVWDNVASYVVGGTKASGRDFIKTFDNMLEQEAINLTGKTFRELSSSKVPAAVRLADTLTEKVANDITKIYQAKTYGQRVGEVATGAKNLVTNRVNPNTVKLFGVGTGITADVNDNPGTRAPSNIDILLNGDSSMRNR